MTTNNFLEEMRERLFARRFLQREMVVRQSDVHFTDNLLAVSLNNNLYSSTVNSLVWELEIPFGMMSVIGPFRDFPLGEIDGFDDELGRRYGIDRIGTGKNKAIGAVSHRVATKRTNVEDEVVEKYKAFDEKRRKRRTKAMENVKQTLEESVIFACTKNKNLEDLFRGSLKREGSFSEQDPEQMAGHVVEDLYEELANMRAERDVDLSFLSPTPGDMLINDFNTQAWQYLEDYAEPLRELIIKSWDTHVLSLLDAMTQFDSREHRFTVSGHFVWKDIPPIIVSDYLSSLSMLKSETKMLVEGVRDALSQILALNVPGKDSEFIGRVEDQKEFFMKILFTLESFLMGLNDDSRNFLTIADVTPTGFLDSPMPPI